MNIFFWKKICIFIIMVSIIEILIKTWETTIASCIIYKDNTMKGILKNWSLLINNSLIINKLNNLRKKIWNLDDADLNCVWGALNNNYSNCNNLSINIINIRPSNQKNK